MSLDYLRLSPNPIAAAVVTAGSMHFTVFTARLLRLEYSPTGACKVPSSQLFCARDMA